MTEKAVTCFPLFDFDPYPFVEPLFAIDEFVDVFNNKRVGVNFYLPEIKNPYICDPKPTDDQMKEIEFLLAVAPKTIKTIWPQYIPTFISQLYVFGVPFAVLTPTNILSSFTLKVLESKSLTRKKKVNPKWEGRRGEHFRIFFNKRFKVPTVDGLTTYSMMWYTKAVVNKRSNNYTIWDVDRKVFVSSNIM
jgi:hypothetical protein